MYFVLQKKNMCWHNNVLFPSMFNLVIKTLLKKVTSRKHEYFNDWADMKASVEPYGRAPGVWFWLRFLPIKKRVVFFFLQLPAKCLLVEELLGLCKFIIV